MGFNSAFKGLITVCTKITYNLHTCLCTVLYIMLVCSSVLLRMRNASDRMCRENQNAPFVFNNAVPKNHAVLWENMEEYGRIKQVTAGNIMRRMVYECNITKSADTHSEYVIPIAFLLHERASVLPSYVHRLSCSTETTVTVYKEAIRYSCFGIKISSLWLWPPCFYTISQAKKPLYCAEMLWIFCVQWERFGCWGLSL
jgi:hypothetical protein